MVEIKKLCFTYESEETRDGVRDIELYIPEGQCVVLCGPSGCGKTTLLRLISGLAPLQYNGNLTGDIRVAGRKPSTLTSEEKARLIGMVYQDPRSQFFMSSVREEITFSGENLGYDRSSMESKMKKQCTKLNILELLNHSLNNLSSGQKQKVAIASSCFLSPKLLLLDEPTANLDSVSTETLVDILKEIKQCGITIIICEHRLHGLLSVADRFVCMAKGKIVKDWTVKEFAAISCAEASSYCLRHPDMVKEFALLTPQKEFDSSQYNIRDISFHYRKSKQGFSKFSFDLKRGTITAITGQNGCGKTTLCKIICGLLSPDEGAIYKEGKRMRKSKLCRESYFVMQDADYQLFTESVGNELVLGHPITDEIRKRAYEAMELFHLTDLKERHPASLSGGEKQRVTLAAAWCSDAKIIVLDEPTSGLDAYHAYQVAQYMCRLALKGKVVLVITHDPLLIAMAGKNRINMKK